MKNIKYFISCILCLLVIKISAQTKIELEGENATLKGIAEIVDCDNASGAKMVKNIDNGEANALQFEQIDIPEDGDYFITISYFAANDRNISYKLNGQNTVTHAVPASGLWCYQGGFPRDITLNESFSEGDNSLLFFNAPIIDKIVIASDTMARQPGTFYVSSTTGHDENDGLSPSTAWQNIEKINQLKLLPGDTVLFKANDTIIGPLTIINEGGTINQPVVVSSYDEGNWPVLDGNGYLSTIDVINSGYLQFSNLEITNNGGVAKPNNPVELRYGIYFQNTLNDGTVFEHYRLKNLTFKNIYPTIKVSDNDQTGVNAHAINTTSSWGDDLHPTRFEDMIIENCFFTRTARHATIFKAVNNLIIRNNLFEHVGGAGMVIGNNCTNILVEKNTTNYTGSSIDSRMAGRGSGLWCYKSKNLTAQYNTFKHARGIKDSYGMHIDIGNKNVVYQYNYSEDNEGGFVEILGANINVGYRYNVSIGDGWRTRGDQKGNIFWLAGWSGNWENPVGSDSIFIYNNSIYVRDTITPGIKIETVSKNARIYNNIIYVSNQFGDIQIKNNSFYNDFDYNIWFGNVPTIDEDGEAYRGAHSLTIDPLFKNEIVTDSSGFVLQAESPAIGSGKLIYNPEVSYSYDYFYNNGGLDFFGNPVSNSLNPNIGAFNGNGIVLYAMFKTANHTLFKMYPNPVNKNQLLHLNFNTANQQYTIQIFDIAGKIKCSNSFKNQNRAKLDINTLPAGNYIVKCISADLCQTEYLLIQ